MGSVVSALLLVGALVVVGAGAYAGLRRNHRRTQIPEIAAQKGLQFSEVDQFGSTEVAFPLFREGDGRKVESVMWLDGDTAEPGGSPSRVFDYGFYRIHHDRSGREVQSWHWFTCAMAQPGGAFPELRIMHQGVVGETLDRLTGEPIRFESEEFNDTFRVTCDDRRFASALIDPQMMQFLLETKGAVGVETMGRFVLLISHQIPADEMPILLGLADQFVKHIPAAVWELYPRPEPGATPGVDYDLDGHPVAPHTEDPWHDHPVRPHDLRPPDHQATEG